MKLYSAASVPNSFGYYRLFINNLHYSPGCNVKTIAHPTRGRSVSRGISRSELRAGVGVDFAIQQNFLKLWCRPFHHRFPKFVDGSKSIRPQAISSVSSPTMLGIIRNHSRENQDAVQKLISL